MVPYKKLILLLIYTGLPVHGKDYQQINEGADKETISDVRNTSQLERRNGVFLNVGLLNLFITPSVGYLRFLTDRVFLISYFNYSNTETPDILASYKYSNRMNIDSERIGYLFAVGPEIVFHTFNWPDAKTLLFCGLLVGYYSFSVNLKPGLDGGGRPAAPISVTGSDAWRGFAAGANVGVHVTKPDGLFFLLAFGLMLAESRDVKFKATDKSGVSENGVYNNYFSNYSFTPQITIAIGLAF